MKLFLKYFWLKEMRARVDECREQGILNTEAIVTANKHVKSSCWALFFLFLFFLLAQAPAWAICGFMIMIAAVFLVDRWRFFHWNYAAYCYGEKRKAVVLSSRLTWHNYEVIKYRLLDSEDRGACFFYSCLDCLGSGVRPKVNDVIEVFHNLKNPNHSMPDIHGLKKKYSLRTDIL